MDCQEARDLFLDARRGKLAARDADALREHLASCEACRREEAADAALDVALARLPARPSAPADLAAELGRRARDAARTTSSHGGRSRARRGALVAFAALVVLGIALLFAGRRTRSSESDALVAEAVNDHLRVLYAERPIEIASGGIHQVKPWFAGRLDFAPVLAFGGDDGFPLEGGSVAYFVDRKAAAFVFKRRLHVITVLVFRADGLPWPEGQGEERIGRVRATARSTRGFHTLLFRDGDLGYALVSDVDPADLRDLAARVVGP